MTGKTSIEEKLLDLFDALTREFHTLSASYQNIEQSCQKLNDAERDIKDTKAVVNELNKTVIATKEVWKRIDQTIYDLLSYKNRIDSIPKDTLDLGYDIQSKVGHVLTILDDDFIAGIRSLNSYQQLQEDLKPVVKFSKLMSKPLGILVFIVSFTLAIAASSFGIYKIVKLFVPSSPMIEQKNDIMLERMIQDLREQIDLISSNNVEKGVSGTPPVSQ